MSQIIISMPEKEFWGKMASLMDARIEAGKPPPKKEIITYSIHSAAKELRRGRKKVIEFIEAGILKTTADGRIPQSEIIKYLETYN